MSTYNLSQVGKDRLTQAYEEIVLSLTKRPQKKSFLTLKEEMEKLFYTFQQFCESGVTFDLRDIVMRLEDSVTQLHFCIEDTIKAENIGEDVFKSDIDTMTYEEALREYNKVSSHLKLMKDNVIYLNENEEKAIVTRINALKDRLNTLIDNKYSKVQAYKPLLDLDADPDYEAKTKFNASYYSS